jgi:hypothetical protein
LPFQHRKPFFAFPAGTYNRHVPSEPTHPHNPSHPRVLGLDVGSKRIGLAVSDLLGITAQGIETLHRQNKRLDFAQLEKVIRDYQVAEIVVGYPLQMSGAEGIQAPAFPDPRAPLGRAPEFRSGKSPAARNRNVNSAPGASRGSDGGGVDSAKLDGCEKRHLAIGIQYSAFRI